MMQTFPIDPKRMAVAVQEQRNRMGHWIWLAFVMISSIVLAATMIRKQPGPEQIAWLLTGLGIVAILYHPRNGVYFIVILSMLGDSLLTPWYPFKKNFSSAESLLYAGRAVSFSPLEIAIALTLAVWLLRMAFQRKWHIRISPILIPVFFFTFFSVVGIVYGFSKGGDRTIGLWESRAIFYLLPTAILVSNLIETRTHVRILLWGIIIATGLNGVFGAIYVADILKFQIAGVEAIGEHGLSIRYNVFFVILIAAWMFQGSPIKRVIMPFFLPFVLLSYAANNRRASFIAMAIALLIFAFVLYRFDRKRFWLIVPFCALFSMAYIGVFWNSSGAIGAPAKAIRSVIGQPDPRDASSNVYRLQENINILFTIKSSPIFGVGFGQKFFILVPMADISFFEWWQYITHNSILWIWLKTGVGGFISMLVMIGLSIAAGARTLWRMPNNDMAVAALMALTYIVMHFVYAYVDMSWDAPNMVMVATSIGLIICLIPIVSQESPPPSKRWPWQRDPEPTPRLRPLTP